MSEPTGEGAGRTDDVLHRGIGPPGEPESQPDIDAPPSSPGPELPPDMRSFLRRGLALYPVAVAALWWFTALGVADSLLLAALLELLPVLAVAQVPLAGSEELDRAAAYLGSGAAILFLGGASFVLGRGVVGIEVMGLTVPPTQTLLIWTVLGLVGGLALVGISHLFETRLGWEENPILRDLIPRTGGEKVLFVGLSVAAGLGEELAYRGYVIPVLAGLVGSQWTAAVFSSGIFGFLHAYQGPIGVIRTGGMGFVLAAVYLLSGSLWPAILAHVAIDLIGGLVLGPRMLIEED